MDKRELLKRIIDELPEENIQKVINFLWTLVEEDDEPLSEQMIKDIKEAEDEVARGETVKLEDLIRSLNEENEE